MNSPERMATFSPQSENGSQSPVMSLTDSALGGSTSPDVQIKSNCSSLSDRDEENFESYGENDNVEFDDRYVCLEIVNQTEILSFWKVKRDLSLERTYYVMSVLSDVLFVPTSLW